VHRLCGAVSAALSPLGAGVVLTAGHCVVDETTGIAYAPSGYQIITGTVDTSDPSAQLTGVSRTIVYPGFNGSTMDGDAGLLVLATPTSVPAVRLATPADTSLIEPGTGGIITGWGETQYGAGQLPTSLQWGATVVQSDTYCQQYAGSYDESKLCTVDAPSPTTSTCFGDSGGPLIAFANTGEPVETGSTSTGSAGDIVPGTCVVIVGQKDATGAVTATTVRLSQAVSGACPSATRAADAPQPIRPAASRVADAHGSFRSNMTWNTC